MIYITNIYQRKSNKRKLIEPKKSELNILARFSKCPPSIIPHLN